MIPAQTVRDVFDRDAAFARAIVSELAERYREIVRSLKNEKLRTSAERLANWILRADAQQGHQRCVELMFDKRTLASRLGMTPENLSRNLALLAKYGVKSSGRDIESKIHRRWNALPSPMRSLTDSEQYEAAQLACLINTAGSAARSRSPKTRRTARA